MVVQHFFTPPPTSHSPGHAAPPRLPSPPSPQLSLISCLACLLPWGGEGGRGVSVCLPPAIGGEEGGRGVSVCWRGHVGSKGVLCVCVCGGGGGDGAWGRGEAGLRVRGRRVRAGGVGWGGGGEVGGCLTFPKWLRFEARPLRALHRKLLLQPPLQPPHRQETSVQDTSVQGSPPPFPRVQCIIILIFATYIISYDMIYLHVGNCVILGMN